MAKPRKTVESALAVGHGKKLETPKYAGNLGFIFHKDGDLACGALQMNSTSVSHSGSTRVRRMWLRRSPAFPRRFGSFMRSVGKGSALVPRAREEECTGHGRFPYTGEASSSRSPASHCLPVRTLNAVAPFLSQKPSPAIRSATQTEFHCLLSPPPHHRSCTEQPHSKSNHVVRSS